VFLPPEKRVVFFFEKNGVRSVVFFPLEKCRSSNLKSNKRLPFRPGIKKALPAITAVRAIPKNRLHAKDNSMGLGVFACRDKSIR
jgi:hypothetical protein